MVLTKALKRYGGVDPSDFEKKRDTAVYQFYMDYLPDSGSERTERSFPCIFKRWDFDQSRPVSVFGIAGNRTGEYAILYSILLLFSVIGILVFLLIAPNAKEAAEK